MLRISAFLAGLLFGIGLIFSGMSDPAKVLAFLDVFGDFNPALLFVMTGALAVGSLGFYVAKRRQTSFLGEKMDLPKNTTIDKDLVLGALLFGIGWGFVGICPGPVLVNLLQGAKEALIFFVFMSIGMFFHRYLQQRGVR